MGGLLSPHAHLPRRVSRCCRLTETANMSANQTRESGALRCLEQIVRVGERGGREITSTHSIHITSRRLDQQHNTHWNLRARKTHTLDSCNGFKEVGATALAPALSRLTGLISLDLRCAPQRVSDMSRLSRSGTVR